MKIRKQRATRITLDLSHVEPELRAMIEARWLHLFVDVLPSSFDLLEIDSNVKTVKGQNMGVKTAVMYLAPANLSGENVCAMAFLAECVGPCLFKAGKGGVPAVIASRLRKTLFWLQYPELFLEKLKRELVRAHAKVTAEGYEFLARPNGTSDIRWEKYGLPQSLPFINFYDYTKLSNRRVSDIPNYDLTFSYSGAAAFQPHVERAKAAGMRIAVVFRTEELVADKLARGETFLGLPLIDGDNSDLRPRDPQGVIVALYAKGPARKDRGPFVVD